MRPIKLIVDAFGPYAGEQVFDFARLDGRSFFLIHGPTGAGKTSILDAICFALYGQASGTLRNPKGMRSDHADPATLTEVTFDFALGPQRYRVWRSPEQERPKKKGGGTTTQQQTATLWKILPAEEPSIDAESLDVVADGWIDVNEAVEGLMGFECDQFRQVVMLPQGQFQKLLMDKSADRQTILETLFQVASYGRIEEALKSAAVEIRRRSEASCTRRDENLKQSGASGADELEARKQSIEVERGKLRIALAALREAKAAAQKKFAEARQIAAKLAEHQSAVGELRGIEAKREEFALKQAALERSQKADRLADADVSRAQRAREAEEAAKKRAGARGRLTQAEAHKQKADAAVNAERQREPEREKARKTVADLAEIAAKVASLSAAREEVVKASAALARQKTERDRLDASLKQAREQIQSAEASVKALELAHAKAAALQPAVNEANRVLKLRMELLAEQQKLAGAQTKLTDLNGRVAKGEQKVAAAKTKYRELQAAWAGGQAAILAASLEDGRPCPVCGSLEHPHPAPGGGDLPRQEILDEQRALVEECEKLLVERKEEQGEQRSIVFNGTNVVGRLTEQLGDFAAESVESLRQRSENAEAELKRAQDAGLEIAARNAQLAQLKAHEATAEANLQRAEVTLAAAGADVQAKRAVAAEREAGVPEHLRTADALHRETLAAKKNLKQLMAALETAEKAATEAAVALASALEAARHAEETATSAAKLAEASNAEFMRRLNEEGFADESSYRAARRSRDEMEQLDRQIRQFNLDFAAARKRVERAEADASGLAAPDLAALEAADRSAEESLEQCVRQEQALTESMKQLDAWLASVRSIDAELKGLEERYSVVGQISNAANGTNRFKMTFRRYVLGVFLDEVLAAATLRLRIMSGGRFSLQRMKDPITARSSGGGGLDLEVHDTYTSTTRPVSTLSGGESFLASLALALGLADVVQAYAGGIRLDTIFVDEGFGTLDPESLDGAIKALKDLQKGGRLVGIISHVTELQELIDARLEVLPARKGSTARFVVG